MGRGLGRALILLLALWAAPGAVAEKVLHRGNYGDPETLDPHKVSGQPEIYLLMDLFEGLATVDAAGRTVPGVAQSWTVSQDGLTYVFTLRPDARWSDGTSVTAEDFVFAWRRLVDPATMARYAYFLWPVRNAEALTNGKLTDPTQLGVVATGPRTLVVTLDEPTPYFPALLTHPATAPLHRAQLERDRADFVRPGKLVSNGAFTLAENVPQSHIKTVRNPAFHAAQSVALDAVYWYPTENQDTELKRWRAGELHVTYTVPDSQVPNLRQTYPGEFRMGPFLATYYYGLNLTREPWKSSPQLRRALSLAIDRQALVEKITLGGEVPAVGLVPPGLDGYAPVVPDGAALSQADREREARQLAAAAGFGPGGKPLELEILFNTHQNHRKIAIAIAAMWQKVLGAKVRLGNLEWKVFLDVRARKAFDDVIRLSWVADYPDATSFLDLLRSDIGGLNPSAFADPRYDALLDLAAVTRDRRERVARLREAEALMLEQQPIIPLFHYVTKHMVSAKVKGWQDNPLDFHLGRWLDLHP